MQDNFNIHEWRLNKTINELEEKQCPECGCQIEGTMCNKCGYIEESTFTDKHDNNPKLKGDQKELPDEVQAKIINKTETTNPMNEASNPEGDKLVLRFLQGIAKKYDYPVAQAALFVKERIKSLGY